MGLRQLYLRPMKRPSNARKMSAPPTNAKGLELFNPAITRAIPTIINRPCIWYLMSMYPDLPDNKVVY